MLKRIHGKGALLSFFLIALLGVSASAFAGTGNTKPTKAKTTAAKKSTKKHSKKKKVVKKKRHHRRHRKANSTKKK